MLLKNLREEITQSPMASKTTLLVTAILFLLGVVLSLCIKNLYLSPLRKIPGPRLAAITDFWLWTKDLNGTTPEVIRRLHKTHGPIVRLGPNSVSVNDVKTYNEVFYRQAPRFMKDRAYYRVFESGPEVHNIFSTSDPSEHSTFRRLISSNFARKYVNNFVPEIWETVNTMLSILVHNASQRKVVDISKMYRCMALDVSSKYAYGQSYGALSTPKFEEDILEAFDRFSPSNYFFMMFPNLQWVIAPILAAMPHRMFKAVPQMIKKVGEGLDVLRECKWEEHKAFVPVLAAEQETGRRIGVPVPQEHLVADGMGIILAGTDTTGMALACGTWAIFSNRAIYEHLHAEVKSVWPDRSTLPSLQELEKLPYLSACVKETLRFTTPIRGRLPRVTPSGGWTYQEHFIPANTIVSSSSYLLHYNEKVFPSPEIFQPERWLSTDPAISREREDSWAPFSKGARICIGLNLAMAELYVAMAAVVRRFRAQEVVEKNLRTSDRFTITCDDGLHCLLEEVHD